MTENQTVAFEALDPGHAYALANMEGGTQPIQFIKKDAENGQLITVTNGTTNEVVIAVLIDRLKFLNVKSPSPFNDMAISHLESALKELNLRTEERKARGVEGTPAA